jgi:hypothetical protein
MADGTFGQPRPNARQAALLTHACCVLPPQFDRLAALGKRDGSGNQVGEVLYASPARHRFEDDVPHGDMAQGQTNRAALSRRKSRQSQRICPLVSGHELNEGHPYGQQAKCHNGRLDIRAHGAVSRLYRQDDRSGVIAMSMGSM